MPRIRLPAGLGRLGLLIAAIVVAAGGVRLAAATYWPRTQHLEVLGRIAGLVGGRQTVSGILAREPAPAEIVEVDAYYSGAGRPPGAEQAACAADPWAVLSDEPYHAELLVLGESQPNPLSGGPWLVAAPSAQGGRPELPYHARLRGRLRDVPPSSECPVGVRVFEVERVVRVYAQNPPSGRPAALQSWPRFEDAEAGYSVPYPPGWRVEQAEAGTWTFRAPEQPDYPVTIRAHDGETHHDPYELERLPVLLQGRNWGILAQNSILGEESGAGQDLFGYRINREGSAERTVAVLFSGQGKTYELSVRYPLGRAASQELLTAYSAIVAGFRFAAPPAPSPTPPVRQAVGEGPFLSEEEALESACEGVAQDLVPLQMQLLSEAEARRLAGLCDDFQGHYDGVWSLALRTSVAPRTKTLRLFVDANTGRELCREEVEAASVPEPTPTPFSRPPQVPPPEALGPRPVRWIEVDLSTQTLIAWEGTTPVRTLPMSSGTAEHPTVTGQFRVYLKVRSMTMSGPGYSLPGVPHVLFFHEGYAIHGAYWHVSFGTPISHGCVNLGLSDAAWLYDWAGPRIAEGEWSVESTPCNPGTIVVVH